MGVAKEPAASVRPAGFLPPHAHAQALWCSCATSLQPLSDASSPHPHTGLGLQGWSLAFVEHRGIAQRITASHKLSGMCTAQGLVPLQMSHSSSLTQIQHNTGYLVGAQETE